MFRKISIFSLSITAALLFGAVGVFAQTAPVSGTVELLKQDGTREPVAGAQIDVYRTDIKGGGPPSKTGKKGDFSFAGLLIGSKYYLVVSAPGVSPTYMTVRPGQERVLITVTPGDGRKLTEDEVRKGIASAPAEGSAEPTAEQKKAQADFEAKKKEIEAKNAKAQKTNEIVNAALKAGNEAVAAKNWDVAITQYDAGIAADPDFVGSAPIFYNNRGTALQARAVDSYNKAIKNADPTEKVAGLGAAKKDITDAAAGYLKSWTVLKAAAPEDIVDKNNYEATKLQTLRGARDTFRVAVKTEQVDPTVIDAAKVMIPEYTAVETDAAKKAEANLIFADLYRVTGDSDNAIAAYKKILETSPDDPDALVGAGLSLVNAGFISNNKAQLQEGANYLQKFASAAPDSHKYKADAVALIEMMKKEQNVTPQKVPSGGKKKPSN